MEKKTRPNAREKGLNSHFHAVGKNGLIPSGLVVVAVLLILGQTVWGQTKNTTAPTSRSVLTTESGKKTGNANPSRPVPGQNTGSGLQRKNTVPNPRDNDFSVTDFALSDNSRDASPPSTKPSALAPITGPSSGRKLQAQHDPGSLLPPQPTDSHASHGGHDSHDLDDGEHQPHGAELLGVLPGKTTMGDLQKLDLWKKPGHRETVEDFLVLTYRIDDLPDMPYIQLFLKKGIVQGIVIHLKEPRELADARLAFEDSTHNVRAITVPDKDGVFREIYPEKGLAFVLEKEKESNEPSSRVVQIVVETVNPDYFIIRAEDSLSVSMTNAWSDAKHALLHDKSNAPAHWIIAKLELARGNYKTAKEHALSAVKLDNKRFPYQLTLIDVLKELRQIENAENLLKITKSLCKDAPLYRCEALILEGELARLAKTPLFDKAIECHEKAIEMVKPYMNSEEQSMRIQAKTISIRAHLALALDIAQKDWENNGDRDPAFQWLNAAGILADSLVKKEDTDTVPLWEICLGATEVGICCPDSDEIDSYIQTLRRLSSLLISEKSKPTLSNDHGDPFAVSMIEFKTARALYEALLINEAREEFNTAFSCGEKSLEMLESARKKNPVVNHVLTGKISFHMGTITLKKSEDSKEAMRWFERTKDEFLQAIDNMNFREMVEVGKIFVNMSNLYWKTDKKEVAIALTQKGTELLEAALDGSECQKTDLFIPYTNLATMYNALGNTEESAKFKELAAECK